MEKNEKINVLNALRGYDRAYMKAETEEEMARIKENQNHFLNGLWVFVDKRDVVEDIVEFYSQFEAGFLMDADTSEEEWKKHYEEMNESFFRQEES